MLSRWLIGDSVGGAFDDEALMEAFIRFEVELARAQAAAGLIPVDSARGIAACAGQWQPDVAALVRQGTLAGSLAIPFVRELTAAVAASDPRAAVDVHRGATSQDLLDTALAVCARRVVDRMADAVSAAIDAAAHLAREHASAPMLARTLMQPAGITTVGFKVAGWAVALREGRRRLLDSARDALCVSLGGAIGNLAQMGNTGPVVRANLATALGLTDSGRTWHVDRGAWVALACDAALLAGTAAKIARDVALMAQHEVGEVTEAQRAGRGGSTAMPHKRNPVGSMLVVAAAQGVPGLVANLLGGMVQEHERGLGNWQNELAQWPEVISRCAGAIGSLASLLEGLRFHPERCLANVKALQGVLFSDRVATLLSEPLGRLEAELLAARLCAQAVEQGEPLGSLVLQTVASDPRLSQVRTRSVAECFDLDAAARASARQVDELLSLR